MCKLCQEIAEKAAEINMGESFPLYIEKKKPLKEKTMKDDQLLSFFDIHKNGLIEITHPIIPGSFENIKIVDRQLHVSITLEDLYRMFKLKTKKENEISH